ncbi:protoporphyrinogen oxidase [Paenibacillus larvae]|uniref:Coproporphyrinogen III oxidase n=2 Tax=Paenibacillus larvae TaxID=1464 RepID=A0A6C0QWV9_9BACL|nr:protoporphyrinogen oxidase [Paenibacillus larvae]AQR77620.1 protoporphyrinogen oxidase [Paenibacillus larvae subsp. larvae]AVF21307.1 protoporphyrinogen oxidase HemY [Paenibacillus larvae subsp. larvae]ETK30095.1 protoporphyrinogen oxidase HemY [Paenibacillus larvae subsp. larvae DSM 25719]MCY7476560.1 protoporphyrinogen oxidase [Paenibacillus larvae]MCY7491638.1 protoporphyrinogen oxidase [Paenibacillus larvae]
MKQRPKLLVVGGGMTGLSAAFYLQRYAEEDDVPVQIIVAEKTGKFGGRIHTLRRDGFVFEKGPDSFLARKTPILDLSRELELMSELTGTNPKAQKTYILKEKEFHLIPPGLVLGVPTQWAPFLASRLISPEGKRRVAEDVTLPVGKENGDESLGDFLERRMGKEMLEHVVEPLLAGIYAGDTYKLSLQATFPQFQQAEKHAGSLILGMMENQKKARASAAPEDIPQEACSSAFLTFTGGLQVLIGKLEQTLRSQNHVELRENCGVSSFDKRKDGYLVRFEDGKEEKVDGIVLTTPNFHSCELLSSLPSAKPLRDISYVSVANVILAFEEEEIKHVLDGTGFLVPRKEGRTITACTWTSAKWLHTAPEGKVLLRFYVGRSGDEGWTEWNDEELVSRVKEDLHDLMGVTAEPLFYEVTRLYKSMPQYPVGHLDAIRRLRRDLREHMPGVFVTGAGFEGVGLPDCIRQGRDTAKELIHHIKG